MSDPDVLDRLDPALARPVPPRTWRDRLDALGAFGADLSSTRVVAVVGVVVVAAVVGWRLLAPPAPPPEMQLPLAGEVDGGTGSSRPSTGPRAPGAGPAEGGDAAGGAGPAAAVTAPGDRPSGGTTADEVVVHVAGAVAAPGVQHLPAGSRVVDAVEAAGGSTPEADLGRINLAAALTDGQQVYVLRLGEPAPPLPATGGPGAGDGGAGPAGAGGLIDVNTATAALLDELPGVGPTTAEAIVAHRDEHGPFLAVDDLLDVRGIGEAKLEQIRDLVTV